MKEKKLLWLGTTTLTVKHAELTADITKELTIGNAGAKIRSNMRDTASALGWRLITARSNTGGRNPGKAGEPSRARQPKLG